MRRGPAIATVVVLALIAGSAVGLKVRSDRAAEQDRRDALAAATQWLQAWQERRYDDVDPLTDGSDAPGAALRRQDRRLQATRTVLVPGPLSADGTEVPYSGTLTLQGLGTFTWSSRVRLRERGDTWKVAFDSATVHPRLENGQQLDRRSRSSGRGAIVDREGRPIRRASADLAANVLGTPGRTGLERVLDTRLVGRSAGAVVLADAGTGQELAELERYAGRPPTPVRTTLDLDVQRAAERALDGLGSAAALVAVDSATGQVRALASRPVAGKPQAFTSYAPGSVFKIVTAAALLDSGLTPTSRVECPATYEGTGNASSVRTGPSSLQEAFAQSCNTAFLAAADRLPDGALARTAEAFGFGIDLLPIRTDPSEAPAGGGPEDATAPIGQGRVEATPLLMATVAAAVEDGTWHQPSLVPGTTGLVSRPVPGASSLRAMMRAAVEDGSGSAADLPGAPVSGKTGSAEFGSGGQVHAWFAGYRDGLAFAVFVEVGASGGSTAAPAAARFLRGL